MEKIQLTRAGYKKIIKELEILSRVERPMVVRELLDAAQEGRLERNQDFQSALAHRQRLEKRIRQLQQILANAEVLVGSNLPPTKVRFNSRLRIVNLSNGQEQEFILVSAVEADAGRGHLSISSPLGRALLGRRLGDCIQVQTPGGLRSYRILEIRMEEI
ncbi:MAG: transcription elongation factor GreA [Deltaproteobacteria bacterium]|nr:MAG: transcription elongation factor GreA [Deltaproteobacteria bacterium]